MTTAAEPRPAFLLAAFAGLAGAFGVAGAAAGAHMTDMARLAIAAQMALAHAPALLAIALYGSRRGGGGLVLSGWIIALGLLLFSGSLAYHDIAGSAFFPMSAPAGGTTMILGWLGVTLAALVTMLRGPKAA
ncbi:DUF423 domain-containing protein [Prosthecomicrobium pneumaticum]|uniref:Uncharacterized membrane protein YgdD (TMEM256/DUF423 family) n=1 Tax=Prosthecomicrobium pneumaticum TaxID=81895 RepID=A0A7W9FPF6_9HYPH|nr:DUF423 domain-containing protein [Prosthecomicrobium pneumaticum]MBB5754459.1 uncharacterized membrane protein YgdD (TMEM256/DUF423 family) [Prosthecomicrobium pneumaticum]